MNLNYTLHGWVKQKSDSRDLTIFDLEMKDLFYFNGLRLPGKVDLRSDSMPAILDQGALGSCTANAAAALISYCIHSVYQAHFEPSRLFQYYNSRLIMGTVDEDSGATIRDAVKAIAKYGAIPESMRPYDITKFREKPTLAEYWLGEKHQALKYVLLDPPGAKPEEILAAIKKHLSLGYPLEFGTPVYKSIYETNVVTPTIQMPKKDEEPIGGHAMVMCGFNDLRKAFLIRNSWGLDWGEFGYGWMPYNYVVEGLACDIWALMSEEWV